MNIQTNLQRWERRTEWPLAVAALIFLVPVLRAGAGPAARARSACAVGGQLDHWGVFVLDYVVRLCLATDRWRWFLPASARFCDCCAATAAAASLAAPACSDRSAAEGGRGCISGPHRRLYRLGCPPVDLHGVAGRIRQRAIPARRNHQLLREGAVVVDHTVTTVGYGDVYPVTNTGRVIAVLLMIGGISLVGVVTRPWRPGSSRASRKKRV